LKRMMLVLTGLVMMTAVLGLSALSSAAQDGALDTGGGQYEDEGALDTGGDQYEDEGALDTGDDYDDDDNSPATPQCGWYYMTHSNYAPWWEYWCWWPGWGWGFVFWVWA
jgi:hypothetical protein